MKKLLIIFLVLVMPTLASAGDYDFRKIKWGMTPKEVMATEKGEPHKQGTQLMYMRTLASNPCILIYNFSQNKLTSTMYLFQQKHFNRNLFIDDFKDLRGLLIKKYGNPTTKIPEQIWTNDLYETEPQHWGLAISLGHLQYNARWETKKTEIVLMLTGDNFVINYGLAYTSKELKSIEQKKQETEKLNGL